MSPKLAMVMDGADCDLALFACGLVASLPHKPGEVAGTYMLFGASIPNLYGLKQFLLHLTFQRPCSVLSDKFPSCVHVFFPI